MIEYLGYLRKKGVDGMADIMIFKRREKKYLITQEDYMRLMGLIKEKLAPDKHGKSTVCSLYLDTPSYLLIRNSIDAVSYKEKLRLRSYGVPNGEKNIFFEIKKKYKGIVYKRRVTMDLDTAYKYMESREKPFDSQIMREIDYMMKFYNYPQPNVCILCEREAFFGIDEPDVRLTFDRDLRYRRGFPNKENIREGTRIINANEYIMEIKTSGAMPLWLAGALSECGIYPGKFSKYAHAYYDIREKEGN